MNRVEGFAGSASLKVIDWAWFLSLAETGIEGEGEWAMTFSKRALSPPSMPSAFSYFSMNFSGG